MKFRIVFASLTGLFSTVALANDGGIAAIKVDSIKMREIRQADGQETAVTKIARPNFKILIEGGEAEKLQKILPPNVSVLTVMHPELAADYAASFRSLGIWNAASDDATAKVIRISCESGTLKDEKIIKTGKSVCTISVGEGSDAPDVFGDAQVFTPQSCQP